MENEKFHFLRTHNISIQITGHMEEVVVDGEYAEEQQ